MPRDAYRFQLPLDVASELPTPCLVVDVEACERNITRAAEYYAAREVKLRPHYKAHKCSTLLRRQVAAGSCVGVTCATAWEAEILAAAGFDRILVANQVVDRPGLAALGRAAARSEGVIVAVDSLAHIDRLQRTSQEASVTLGVLIEVDVGMDRCGLEPGHELLLGLAEAIAAAPALELRGLQGYEGHAVLRPTRTERQEHVLRAAEIVSGERTRLEAAGYRCEIASGGGTGTYDLAAEAGVLDEIQAGSYVLMDARYATLDLPFENALYCATTVLSRRRPTVAALNAGLKALSVEFGMPKALRPDLNVTKLADEHAWLTMPEDAPLAVGDVELLVPAHVDPAVNLHDGLFAWDAAAGRLEVWPVDGRKLTAMATAR